MTDEQQLIIIMGVLYLLECLKWVPLNSIVLKSYNGYRFGVGIPSMIFGNAGGGLVFLNPLPPLGIYFKCYLNPVSISPKAIFSFISSSFETNGRPNQSERLALLKEIKNIEIYNKEILINNELFVNCQSASIASKLKDLIEKLLLLSESDREIEIKSFINESFKKDAIEKKLRQFNKKTLFLKILCNLFFLYLFGIIPYYIFYINLVNLYLPLLAIMICFTGAISIESCFVERKIFGSHNQKQLGRLLRLFLYPFAAVRALDDLSVRLFEEFNILACASLLCNHESFKDIAGKILRDLHYPVIPVCPTDNPDAKATEEWYRKEYTDIVEQFVSSNGIELKDLSKPEMDLKDESGSYCPRCLTLYSMESGVCPDCIGVTLKPISSNMLGN